MSNNAEIVATINFSGYDLNIYNSLDKPLFRAEDVAKLIEYSTYNTSKMLLICEDDEVLELFVMVSGKRHKRKFVTEMGFYNILSHSSKPIAHKWRKIVRQEFIDFLRNRDTNFIQQMEKWDFIIRCL